MLVVDLAGTELTALDAERLRHPAVGMVILFRRNFADADQLAALTASIRALRDPPLAIAVDHEGGRVQRFRDGFTRVPPMAALGRCWDVDVLAACRAAWSAGLVIGAELRAVGVDLSFTPVLDLDWGRSAVIGDRALHADPRVVTLLAGQLMHGLAAAGVSHCGKHFPGHGWPAADSHVDVPVDDRPLDEILAADAAPYRQLGPSLAAVMPAHVIYPQVDAQPAGFSRVWIQDILRGRLGFTGAVFSDDLSMAGARVAGDIVARCEAARAAGCDWLLVCNDAEAADAAILAAGRRRVPRDAVAVAQATLRRARMRPMMQATGPQPSGAAALAALAEDPRYVAAREDVLRLAEAHGEDV